jgi:methyltransferase, FkbM family
MNFLINFLGKIEYLLSILQGKGFGAARISLFFESKKALGFFNGSKKITVFDVGGNIGEYSEKILSLNQNSQITIFEPSKKNAKKLKYKFKDSKKIKIENMGINSKNGYFKLYYDKMGSPLASLSKKSFLGSSKKLRDTKN